MPRETHPRPSLLYPQLGLPAYMRSRLNTPVLKPLLETIEVIEQLCGKKTTTPHHDPLRLIKTWVNENACYFFEGYRFPCLETELDSHKSQLKNTFLLTHVALPRAACASFSGTAGAAP